MTTSSPLPSSRPSPVQTRLGCNVATSSALNPASVAWGRDVEKRNATNEQALIRTTMELQNTDRALQDSITRLNAALVTVQKQNDYILSLAVKSVAYQTGDIAIPDGEWATTPALRPTVEVLAPSGRIRIIVCAYGHNAVLTYSIPGVVDRATAVSSYINQSSQLVLPGGAVSMTSQKEWVQAVPADRPASVTVECKAVGAAAIVASPTLIVQVLPA